MVYASTLPRTETDEASGEEVERNIPYMKGYTVFNVEQIEGLPEQYHAPAQAPAGHHHVDEAWPFYEEAKARGVKRMFLNHPTYVNGGSMADISRLVQMGVKIEHSICMFIPSTFYLFDRDHLKSAITAAGVENTFFGSDLGQNGNPTPVEGMGQIIDLLLDIGFGEPEIVAMTSRNAARFVGVD